MGYFSKKNILITGADGYIGSSVTKLLLQRNCRLFLLSRYNSKPHHFSDAHKNISIIQGDITDKNIWRDILKNMDIVYHFAAQTSSKISNDQPELDLQINVLPVINLITTVIKYGYKPDVIFAGTVTETGFTDKGKINENRKDLPITVYDIHKLTAEKYLQYYGNQLNYRSVTLRLCNIYGPGPASSKPDRGIVNMMIRKALKGEPIAIYGNGKFMRDYLYISDVAVAFIKAAEHINKTKGNYYVLGTGTGHTVLDMARLIAKNVKRVAKRETRIQFSPFPNSTSKIEYRNFVADPMNYRKDTGWSAKISLQKGIAQTVAYFMK